MSLPTGHEFECTPKCKSTVHGDRITAACTKRTLEDSILAGFLVRSCRNFANVTDREGRSALHLVASTNRPTIVQWLLKNGANANAKDLESGQTPLHRALFYGCIKSAIVLLQNNASIDVCDVEYLSPLHYCLTSKRKPNRRPDTETFAFGSNSHYNLGLDLEQGTQIPKCIEYFKRNGVSIKSVALSPFHSLFLANSGDVFTVGHGVGGRLGHGQESTLVTPQKLNLRLKRTDEKIISFSASKNHSLILSNLNYVYACGNNARGQLGLRSNESILLEFKNINCNDFQDQNLIRVIALDSHSIAYSTTSLFAWGQNTGQLGLRSSESVIATPQLMLSGQQILLLDACNTGLAFYSGTNKSLNIFNNYKMRFFKTPALEVIKQLSIGDADKVLKVLVMTDTYQIYIWDDVTQRYTKCYYSVCRQFEITKMFWSGNKIYILAGDDVMISTSLTVVKYNESEDVSEYQEIYSTKKDICQTNRIRINLKRVPFASNVKDVWCDTDGLNCIFIRDDPYLHLKVPSIQDYEVTLDVLHEEMSEFDGIHDVLFHVDRQVFAAHKYVLLSRAAATFAPWIDSSDDKKNCYLDGVEGLTATAFEMILKIIYKNLILTEHDITRLGGDLTSFTKLMKSLNLSQFLQKNKKNLPKMQFDRNDYPDLLDVTIRCANDRNIHAHKCILVSRLKYFNMMFSSSWMEASEVNFTTIPAEYVEVLIDFLYDNSASRLLSKKYTEAFITNMLVIADQLFIDRLKDIFQVHVLKRFTMKRSTEWLELAFTYHCDLLKKSIFDFLCANLSEVLENRYLEHLDMDYLTELDERYKDMFPEIKYRQVVPSPAISEELIESLAKGVVVDLSATSVSLNGSAQKGSSKGVREPKSATKTKTDYEKEGKLSLQLKEEEARIEDSPSKVEKNLAAILSEESARVAEQEIQERNKAIWTKVATDKKSEPKRKVLVNANEVLRNEDKMCENFSNLKLALNEERNRKSLSTPREDEGSASIVQGSPTEASPSQFNSLSLGDFLSSPSSGMGRLSQKQRKRQSSRASESEGGGEPGTPYRVESVWNVPSNDVPVPTPDFGESSSRKKTPNGSSQKTNKANKPHEKRVINFDAILVEDKREKEYFTKLKNKSLAMTQLEEVAIGELLNFYNAAQVFDETIVIVRKVRQQVSQNFSQWARPADSSTLEYVASGGASAAAVDGEAV